MTSEQGARLLLALLDDDHGVCEAGHVVLMELIESIPNKTPELLELILRIRSANGRFYIK